MKDINKAIYAAIRSLQGIHNTIFKADCNGRTWHPGKMQADAGADIYSRETAQSMAERITQRSAILLNCDLRRISSKATIADARREKEIAQNICDAKTEKQLNAALEEMRALFLEIRSR